MDISVIERESTLTVVNARPEYERAAQWLDAFAVRSGVPAEVSQRLLVVLDEVLSNVVNHALAGSEPGTREVRLRIRLMPTMVQLQIIDDGPPFDPAAYRAKERPPEGGAGLLFVRGLMDEVKFTRWRGHNRLTVCKQLAATA